MEEYYYTINGNRRVHINGRTLEDFLPIAQELKGARKSPAFLYLESLGFSEEDALEYLESLPEKIIKE
jgi:hypothetical protein